MSRVVVFFLFLFISCSVKEDKIITFKVNPQKSVKLSDIFSVEKRIDIISEKPVGGIKVLHKINDQYLALIGGNISKIDQNGYLEKKLITKQNSYLFKSITSFDVFNNKIYTLERSESKFKIIDDEFNIIEEHELPFYPLSFKVISENKVLFYVGFQKMSSQTHQLLIYDLQKNKVVGTYKPIDDNLSYFNVFTIDNFVTDKNEILFWNGLDQNIYKFKEDGLSLFKTFKYKNKNIPDNFYKNSKFDDVREYMQKMNTMDFVSRFYGMRLQGDYLLKTISYSDKRYFVFKNLRSNSEYCSDIVIDDIMNSGEINSVDDPSRFIGNVDEYFVIYIENTNYESDTSHVGTMLFGRFKF